MANNPVVADNLPQVKRRPLMDNFIRPALVVVMTMCVGVALVNFVRAVNPAWHGGYFLFGLTLVAVEAVYSSRLLISYGYQRYESVIRFRLVEWGILLILLKIISLAGKSSDAIVADLKAIGSNPAELVSNDYLAFIVLAFLIWLAVSQTMTDFENLYDPFQFRQATLAPYHNLTQRFFWGGGIIIVVSGFSRWMEVDGYQSLLNLSRASLSGIVLNVLIYFVAGLVLLSQAQLTALFTRWEIQKISVSSGLARRWVKYGLAVLGLVSAAVFFLPTGYSMGLLNSLGLALEFAIGFILLILQLIALFITLILSWFAALFGTEEELQTPTPTPAPLSEPANTPGNLLPPDFLWLELLRSLAFWFITVGIIIYLLRAYLKDHPEILAWFKSLRFFRLSFDWFKKWWRRLLGAVQAGLDLIPRQINLPTSPDGLPSKTRWGRPQMRNMSPREQILYYYLNILQRAERIGVVRKQSQTPAEFSPRLNQIIPETEAENNLLTEAFVHARYSRRPFDAEQAALVRTIWRQIRSALREAASKK